ncbi:MAG: hypothetical protein IPM66_10660 [Acidobacteriota bacterium]|nr:MAG: hypothetical protein IPM66_10660 [Acidobacteriota bacterium]
MNDFLTNLAERSLDGASGLSGDIPGERATALRPRLALPFERPDHALFNFEEPVMVGATAPWGTGVLSSQVSEEDDSINYHAEADGKRRMDKPVIRKAFEPVTSENIRSRISLDRPWSFGRIRSNDVSGELLEVGNENPSHIESRRNARDGIYRPSARISEADFNQNDSDIRKSVVTKSLANNPMNEPIRSTTDLSEEALKRNTLPANRFNYQMMRISHDISGENADHTQTITRSPFVSYEGASDREERGHRQTIGSIHGLKQIAQSIAQVASRNTRPAVPDKIEQVINVSIGRIEVRATQPAAPIKAERPRNASPLMSLNEYLQKRTNQGSTGGGR